MANYFLKIILSLFVLSVFSLSFFVPPFQSPDEFEHIKRAYLLTTGNIILKTEGNQSSGGQINTGLLDYFHQYEKYPFSPDQKITSEATKVAQGIEWTQESKFSPVYNISSNFPGLYFPQAVGLWIGKLFNFSVANSYYIARLLVIFTSCGLIVASCMLFTPSPLIFSILFLPMSLYQFSSPSLDGIATATFIFILSIFFYTVLNQKKSKGWVAIPMGIFVFLLTSSRVHSLPILLLVYCSYFLTKKRSFLIAAIIPTLLSAIWLYISIKNTYDSRIINTVLPIEIVRYYATNPLNFFKVIYATYTNNTYLAFYARSSLGNLGWADWPQSQFSTFTYYFLGVALVLIGIFSTSIKQLKQIKLIRIALFICALISVFIISFSLLVAWTTHPAKFIEGIQGRYFHFPLLFLGYSLISLKNMPFTVEAKCANILLFFYIAFTYLATLQLVNSRYY